MRQRRAKLDGFDDPTKKKAARNAADVLIAQLNERNNRPPKLQKKTKEDKTFKQFAEGRWKAYMISSNQPSTIDQRNSLLKNHLLPFFGEMKMHDITRSNVSDFFESLQGNVSVNTAHNLYGVLSSMFVVAREHGIRKKKSPVRSKIHRPKVPKTEKPVLTADQIKSVLSGLPNVQERLFAIVIAVTGMRMGEALALRRRDFNSGAREISVNHTLYRGSLKQPKTETSKRTIKLDPSIVTLIDSHLTASVFKGQDDFIFCRNDGRPENSSALRTHLYKSMDRVGINRVPRLSGFHCLRRSAGTLVYLISRDLRMVQELLGHSDISITSVYVHPGDRVVTEASEILTREILGICDPLVTHESDLVK